MRFLLFCVSLVILSGCSAAFDFFRSEDISNIQGIVTDTDGNPINHIKVTLSTKDENSLISVYTSSNGEFAAEIELDDKDESNTLTIILEDIDKEENGGLFETLKDQIVILEDDSKVIRLAYQMTLSTSSENTLPEL